jgi:hypothetical protein
MPFTKMNQPPDSSMLLKPEGLVFLPPSQVDEQVAYWRRVGAIGGFLQMQLGQTFLMTLDHVAKYRTAAVLPEARRLQPHLDIVGRMSLAGLALGQLMRTLYVSEIEDGAFDVDMRGPSMDFYMSENQQIAVMHHPVNTVGEVLPGYTPGKSPQHYEDRLLVVRADAPAHATANFMGQYTTVGDGRAFDSAAHVTLTPQLKIDFVAPLG